NVCCVDHATGYERRQLAVDYSDRGCWRQHAVYRLGRWCCPDGTGSRYVYLYRPLKMESGDRPGLRCKYRGAYVGQCGALHKINPGPGLVSDYAALIRPRFSLIRQASTLYREKYSRFAIYHSIPFWAFTPLSNACLIDLISLTVSAASIKYCLAPRPVMMTF